MALSAVIIPGPMWRALSPMTAHIGTLDEHLKRNALSDWPYAVPMSYGRGFQCLTV